MRSFARCFKSLLCSVPLFSVFFFGILSGCDSSRSDGATSIHSGHKPASGLESHPPAGPFGCTIVMAARDGLILVGNNEDRNNTETIVSVIPATKTFYGRIIFGYSDAPIQGGMNDQGLVIDGNALGPTGWRPDSGKATYQWSTMMAVLATCATCEDVRAFFKEYNVPGLSRARFPVADRSGASMVVEWAQGGVQFVTSDTWYQIATNFVISDITDGNYPCWRYRTADKMFSESEELSLDLIREILKATHQEGRALTVYSTIYDMQRGTVYIYNLRNFEEVVAMNLCDELKKGERTFALPSLFSEGKDGPRDPG